jgi:serine phosphatase RsbU (regulator of sigma subunit)
MQEPEIHSAAFDQARLKTERLRILGVLIFAAVIVVVTAIRTLILHTGAPLHLWLTDLAVIAVLVVYELASLRWVQRALKTNDTLHSAWWSSGIVFEALLPTLWMALLSSSKVAPEYQPLANPAVLVFFILIILSILRLSRRTTIFTGVMATAGYLAASLYIGWRPAIPGTPAPVTQTMVPLYAITLLVGGFLAGVVAEEVRKNVQVALREAETQRRLEAVQHDLQVARSIQQSLLPKEKPSAAGFEVAGWNQPADDTGGDYYDWMPIAGGKLVVMLADVTGHGIGPALLAASSRAYARASFETQPDLLSAFQHMNQAMRADLDPRRFVTFAGVECSPNPGKVEVYSAGHAPLFFYSAAEDRFWEMDAHAPPLGILPMLVGDPPAQMTLAPGDLILLVTDGFFEWENKAGEQFGSQRLEAAVRASRQLAPEAIIQKLYASVLAFAEGSAQKDDLTAVVIKRT